MDNPLVSIIIPVYKYSALFKDCIKSTINQTYVNVEIVVVDSTNNDNVKNTIEETRDERIILVSLPADYGLNTSFDIGFEKSKGDFIVRCDPDDVMICDKIDSQVDFLLNNSNCMMVSCLIECEHLQDKYEKNSKRIQMLYNAYKSEREIEKAVMSGFIPVLFPTIMFRRELYSKVRKEINLKVFDNQLNVLTNFLKIAPIDKVDKILYIYRRHKDAFHIKNEVECNKYTAKCLRDSGIVDFLKARYLRDENRLSSVEIISGEESYGLRVLLLVDSLDIGGTETHVLSLAKELLSRGIHVVVATSSGPLRYMFDKFGIKVMDLGLTKKQIQQNNIYGAIGEVKNIMTKEGINIIHTHSQASMKIGAQIYRNYQVPHVITFHGLYYNDETLWTTCFDATKFIAVSDGVRSALSCRFKRELDDRIYVIPNGIDTSSYIKYDITNEQKEQLGINKDGIVVMYSSRLSGNKAVAAKTFIRSCYEVAKEHPMLQAIVLGDGYEKWNIINEANLMNGSIGRKFISVKGFKLKVSDYYNACDIVVGTGRVAIEAMSCGKPVIALGDKGFNGIVLPELQNIQMINYFGDHRASCGFSREKLTKAINKLVDDESLRHELGEWGREFCTQNYNIKDIVDKTIQVYRECLR